MILLYTKGTKMTQKLFFVEVTKSGWVLADDEADAKKIGRAHV